MSEVIKLAKKRGRPKKLLVAETVVLIESPLSTSNTIEKPKSRGPKTTKSRTGPTEADTMPKKHPLRKTITKDDVDIDTPKASRIRKSAKNAETVTSTLENIVNVLPQASVTHQSSVLEQATAFKEVRQKESISSRADTMQQASDVPQNGPSPGLLFHTENLVEDQVNRPGPLDKLFASSDKNVLSILDAPQLPISRTREGSRDTSYNLQHTYNEVARSESDVAGRVTLAPRLAGLHERADALKRSFEQSAATELGILWELDRRRRWAAPRETNVHVGEIESAGKESINRAIAIDENCEIAWPKGTDLREEGARHAFITALGHRVRLLDTGILESATALRRLREARQQPQPPDTKPPATQFKPQPQPSSSPHPPSSSSPPQTTSKPSTTDPTTPPPQTQSQARPRYQSPPSLQQRQPPSKPPSQPQPRPLRPTEQPYDLLKKDPNFKRQSRRWTGIIVGIPVVVATSWVLFKRYQDTLMKRIGPEEVDGRRRGEVPGWAAEGGGGVNATGRGIGVDRSSTSSVNGGV